MATQILEGTLTDIQRKLRTLSFAPRQHLRVVVMEAEPVSSPEPEPFRPTEFRNGVPLLPRRPLAEPMTLERVKQLLDADDEETLHACRTTGR